MSIVVFVHPNTAVGTPKFWAYDRITFELYYAQVSRGRFVNSKGSVGDSASATSRQAAKMRKGYVYLGEVTNNTELRNAIAAIAGEAPASTEAQNLLKVYRFSVGQPVAVGTPEPLQVKRGGIDFELPVFTSATVLW